MYKIRLFADGRWVEIFTAFDPRDCGFNGPVEGGYFLDDEMASDWGEWPAKTKRTVPVRGVHPDEPKDYRLYRSDAEREAAGYLPTPYLTIFRNPEEYNVWLQGVESGDPDPS